MIKAVIVGYGNIGHFVLDALKESPDFEVAGVVRRDATNVPAELKDYKVTSDLSEIKADVAILCTPTRKVEEYAKENSFTIHPNAYVVLTLNCEREEMARQRIDFEAYVPSAD